MAKQRTPIKIEDILNSKAGHLNQHLLTGPVVQAPAKESKYRNTATLVDGIRFDSKKEAKRYKELKILLKAGVIGMLARQVEYELNVGGKFSYVYKADFVYQLQATGEVVVEDVKGELTSVYRKKRRLMLRIHGIKIKEI